MSLNSFNTPSHLANTIALVANSTWNIYNFRLNFIEKLLEEGYQVIVIAPIDEYVTYLEKYPKVRHYGLRMLDRDSTNPFKDFLHFLELARKYKKLKPDLIIHFTNKPNIYGAFAAKANRISSIGVVTGLGYAFIHNGLVQRLITLMYQLSGRFHQRFIFENQRDRALFVDLGIVRDKYAISVKGCGVDTNYYVPTQAKRLPGVTTFTFIGRLLYDKGINEFVEAARLVKKSRNDIQFWIVGELDFENPASINPDDLVHWVENGIVHYYGFIKDVRPIIADSDCIVLPSYREGLPRIVVEGMAMGKPVITTHTAGCEETVEEGVNGYLVEVKDTLALSEAMVKFADLSPEAQTNMGAAGRRMACEIFDSKKVAQNLFDILKNL